jgi:hypothetical protein
MIMYHYIYIYIYRINARLTAIINRTDRVRNNWNPNNVAEYKIILRIVPARASLLYFTFTAVCCRVCRRPLPISSSQSILTISGRVTYRSVRVTCSWTRTIRPGVPEADTWCRRNARLEPSPCWLLRSRNVPFQMSSNPMWGSWARTSCTGNPIFWCRNACR